MTIANLHRERLHHERADRERSRREFLGGAGSFAFAAALRRPCARRHGARRQVRPRDQGRRCARPQPVVARSARHRHPLRLDRGGRSRHSGGARAARARRRRQAGDARIGRPALPRLPVWLGDRHSGGRARAASMQHHLRVGRRCRRQQFRGVPPLRRRANAHASLCLCPYRQYGAGAVPGRRALQHRLRAGRRRREGRRRERRHGVGRQSAHVRERDRQARPRTVEACDRGVRGCRHRLARSCAISAA